MMRELRMLLRTDAAGSAVAGVLLAGLSGVLDDLFGLPVPLSVVAGVALVGWAAFVGWVSTRRSHGLAWQVVTGNTVWTLASVGYAVLAWPDLTTPGAVFVLGQAAAVAGLTALQTGQLRAPGAAQPAG